MTQGSSVTADFNILVEEYKTPEHSVFGVSKGGRHWQRFTATKGHRGPFWVEDTSEGHGREVSRKRLRWLRRIKRDGKKYPKLLRFPRTQKNERGKELIQALSEAHAKGENELIQQHLTALQRHVNDLSIASRDTGTQSIWDGLPRFDPSRVKKTKWLIDSFLAETSIQLIFGEAKTFKTTLCLFCAKAVACGESILGKKTRRRRVIYIDFENPASVIRDRCIDLGLNLPNNPNLVIWDRVLGEPPLPGNPKLEQLVRQCVAETGFGPWIIFDSWSSMLRPGDGGETTGQIAPVFARIRKLVDLGATVTVLDHAKKYDGGILYGGADKVAKSDTIHNIRIFESQIDQQNPIVTVDSRLKRYSPEGEGAFAFEVKSSRDSKGKWHISDLQLTADPVEAAAQRSRGLLCDLIRQNPESGQEERRVSTTLRHMLTEFSEFFHVSWTGLLIHAWVGTAGGLGAFRTKRSG
jgi:hypothetical protein